MHINPVYITILAHQFSAFVQYTVCTTILYYNSDYSTIRFIIISPFWSKLVSSLC